MDDLIYKMVSNRVFVILGTVIIDLHPRTYIQKLKIGEMIHIKLVENNLFVTKN